MIVFKKITMQNFLSVGNKPISLNLNADNITLIVGENGQGKSCISGEALFYALYGKSFRKVTLSDLVNTQNKSGLLVELEFSSGSNDYKIIRGIKPNVFEIYVNGSLKTQMASVKDYQDYLVKNILKMDEKTFRQLVIIGSSSYIPFMKLTTTDRRAVIENLLNIDIFSALSDRAKSEYKEVIAKLDEIERKSNEIVNEIRIVEGQKKEQKDTSIAFIQKIDNEILEQTEKKKNAFHELQKLQEKYSKDEEEALMEELRNKKQTFNKIISLRERIVLKKETLQKHLNFFNTTTVCPTCNTTLDPEYVKKKVSEYSIEIKENAGNLDEFDKKKEAFSKSIDELGEKIASMGKLSRAVWEASSNLSNIERSIDILNRQKNEILNSKQNKNDIYDEQISRYKKELSEIDEQAKDVKDHIEALNFVIELCKDSGVKASIIREYVPILNMKIQSFLDIVNFNVMFSFNEQFKESIVCKNKCLEYNNFSEGEKLRIDLAIMFAFREISALRNSVATNILIGDEADHGTLDSSGFEAFCNILLSLKNTNIFLISHTADQVSGIANKILAVEKINGFTHIKVEK